MTGGILVNPPVSNVVVSGNRVFDSKEEKMLAESAVWSADGKFVPGDLWVEVVRGERQRKAGEEKQEMFLCTSFLVWRPGPGMRHVSELRSWVLRRSGGSWIWEQFGYPRVAEALQILRAKLPSLATGDESVQSVMRAESRAVDEAFLPAVRAVVLELARATAAHGHPADLLREIASELDAETVHQE